MTAPTRTFCHVWNASYAPLHDEHLSVCCSNRSNIYRAQNERRQWSRKWHVTDFLIIIEGCPQEFYHMGSTRIYLASLYFAKEAKELGSESLMLSRYLTFRQDSWRQRLLFAGPEPLGLAVPMTHKPFSESQDEAVCLRGSERDLSVLLVYIFWSLSWFRQEYPLLALQYNHIPIIHLVRGPVLMPARHHLLSMRQGRT